jgi:hypothetical protein
MNIDTDKFFALKRPCANCPFLKQGAIELAPGRIEGIIAHLLEDDWNTFPCHKTVHGKNGGEWDDEGEYQSSGKESMCSGAMALLHKVGQPTVPMRLGIVMGKLKVDDLEAVAPLIIEEK